jgi:hypothetical protein
VGAHRRDVAAIAGGDEPHLIGRSGWAGARGAWYAHAAAARIADRIRSRWRRIVAAIAVP